MNAEDGSYDIALHAASSTGHTKIVELLLQAGANVNAGGGRYGSALQSGIDEWSSKGDSAVIASRSERQCSKR